MKRRLIDDNIFLRFDLGRNLWTVLADSPNIDQVIINLVLNARDAMPFGGMINIKTENIYLEKKAATGLEGARSSGSPARARYVCLTVSDNGNGMDEPVLSRIFEPFFTTKEHGRGTGLGLSVLYGIVQSHEGSIDVFSRPGAGSTFKIFLPALRYKFQSLGGKDKESPHEQFYDQEKRILLVEDDPEVLSLTRKVLKKNGYLVFSCRTAADALAIFEQEKGCFDLVVCDIILPDSRGTDLVLKLRQREPSLEVLLVSGFVGEQPALEEIRQQGIPFIPKPYTFEDLLQQIRRQSLHRQL